MKNKVIHFPLLIFFSFLLIEVSSVLLKFSLISESIATTIVTIGMSVVIANMLFFLCNACGVAIGFILVAIYYNLVEKIFWKKKYVIKFLG